MFNTRFLNAPYVDSGVVGHVDLLLRPRDNDIRAWGMVDTTKLGYSVCTINIFYNSNSCQMVTKSTVYNSGQYLTNT